MEKLTLKVTGMDCHSCEMVIGDALKDIGVKAKVDHKTGKAEVEFDPVKTNLAAIKAAIEKEGYKVVG